jgi:hypothetical protein
MDRHPGGPEGVAAPAPLHGRCVAAITAARLGVDLGGKRLGEGLMIQVKVHTFASVQVRERHRSERRRHQTVREDLRLKELLDALALVGHPPGDEDQRLHLLVPGGGVGHDRATVGVADQDNRAGDGLQQGRQVCSVARQVAERVGETDGGKPAVAQARIDSPKPVAPAHAPWTNTMVGVSAVIVVTAPSLTLGDFSRPPIVLVGRSWRT